MTWWGLLVSAKCLFWFSILMELGDLFTIVSPLEMFLIALATTIVCDVLEIEFVRLVGARQTSLGVSGWPRLRRPKGRGSRSSMSMIC